MPTVLKPASEAVERPVRSAVTPSNARVQVSNSTLVETICVETPNGGLYHLFEKGTTLPLMSQETFLTVSGSEGVIEIKVYQGESPLQEKSDPIAGYRIRSVIVPSEIGVTFKVALDGQLSVEACDILRDKALLVIAEWSS